MLSLKKKKNPTTKHFKCKKEQEILPDTHAPITEITHSVIVFQIFFFFKE